MKSHGFDVKSAYDNMLQCTWPNTFFKKNNIKDKKADINKYYFSDCSLICFIF